MKRLDSIGRKNAAYSRLLLDMLDDLCRQANQGNNTFYYFFRRSSSVMLGLASHRRLKVRFFFLLVVLFALIDKPST